MNATIAEMGQRVLDGKLLARDELISLAELSAECPWDLFYWANRLRTKHFSNFVRLCSVASTKVGGCGEDCQWCAQAAVSNTGQAKPRRLSPQEAVDAARQATKLGSTCFGLVSSGKGPRGDDFEKTIEAIEAVQNDPEADVHVSASLGILDEAQAKRLASLGLFRYHHNLETSERMFPKLVSTHSYQDRLSTLIAAKAAGMRICSGGLFGLGETWEDRVDLALTLRDKVQPESVPLNFLHAIPGTALGNQKPLKPMEILSIIAIYRLAMPETEIKVAGGREVNLRDMQSWIFYAGATGCMVGNYLTTSGRPAQDDLAMIADQGLEIMR